MRQMDLIVLGAGPGGYVAALRAAQKGLRVALVEKDKVGGTCLQRGCIPTKALLEAAERYDSLRSAARFGITVGNTSFDYAKAAGRKDRVVMRLTKGIESLLRAQGVERMEGTGAFLDPHTVVVGEERISAKNILIATGSQPVRPGRFSSARCWTSDEMLAAKEPPKSLTILGGGVIGVEFASLFSMLGTRVTIIEQMPRLLPGMDEGISRMLAESLKKRGVVLYLGATAQGVDEETITIEREGQSETLPLDVFLVAVGRRPNTCGLALDKAGVEEDRGRVPVNGHMQTNVPHVYAVGDVTGLSALAHAASSQAETAVDHMLGKTEPWDGRFVPACVYTDPEIASVGLTKAQAQAEGYDVRLGEFPVAANGKAMIAEQGIGSVQLVCDAASGRLLGAHCMGPRATDMIGELCLALRMGARAEDIGRTIHPHPTFVEMLMEAAQDAGEGSVHLPPRSDE